jgi:hypothetical protein
MDLSTPSTPSQTNGSRSLFRFADDNYVEDEWDKGYFVGLNEALEELNNLRHTIASAENNGYIRGFNNGYAAAKRKSSEAGEVS